MIAGTTILPSTSNDWTLGQEQLSWLNQTLANSTKPWKFVFLEHLVGGDPNLLACNDIYNYGRGTLRATNNSYLNGTFLGEQQLIHQIYKDNNVNIQFSAHDHIFAFGEKLDSNNNPENIYYITGGQVAGGGPPFWTGDSIAFNNTYDFNYDNVPDYLLEKGFTKVTVNGQNNVTIEYIASDLEDPSKNGQILFNYTIY